MRCVGIEIKSGTAISMIIKKSFVFLIVYLTFSLDSLLKFGEDVKIHVGVLSVLLISLGYIFMRPGAVIRSIKEDYSFPLFLMYCVTNGLIFGQNGFSTILPYLALCMLLFVYCSITYKWT